MDYSDETPTSSNCFSIVKHEVKLDESSVMPTTQEEYSDLSQQDIRGALLQQTEVSE